MPPSVPAGSTALKGEPASADARIYPHLLEHGPHQACNVGERRVEAGGPGVAARPRRRARVRTWRVMRSPAQLPS